MAQTRREKLLQHLWFKAMCRTDEWFEAAEFEGMVVARLARMMLRPNEYKFPCRQGFPELGCMRDKSKLTGAYAVHCEDCILREIRLAVEEEKDGR